MKKIGAYRVLGWMFFALGAMFIVIDLIAMLFAGELQEFYVSHLFSLVDSLIMLVIVNIPLWVGIIFLWRADRNEFPERNSKWNKFIPLVWFILIGFTIRLIADTIFGYFTGTLHHKMLMRSSLTHTQLLLWDIISHLEKIIILGGFSLYLIIKYIRKRKMK